MNRLVEVQDVMIDKKIVEIIYKILTDEDSSYLVREMLWTLSIICKAPKPQNPKTPKPLGTLKIVSAKSSCIDSVIIGKYNRWLSTIYFKSFIFRISAILLVYQF